MAQKPKREIQCAYYAWYLYVRNGVWYADGRVQPGLGRYSLETRDREEALENLKRLDAVKAVELGRASESALRGAPILIAVGWNEYLDFCRRPAVAGGACEGTVVRYENVRKHHEPFCSTNGITTWNEFDKAALLRYGSWRKGAAYATSYLELTVLKQVVKHLIRTRRLPAECLLDHPLRRLNGSDTYCYSRAQVRAMLDLCRADPELAWLEPIVLTLATTGMRISEAAALRWRDVDFEAGVLHVADERGSARLNEMGTARTTKGRRSRVIPLYPLLKATLATLPRTSDGLVLHAPMGGTLHDGNLRTVLKKRILEPLSERFPTPEGEIGFRHGTLHSFRHYFCSEAFRGGASEGEVREWLGHADSRIVERYRHLRIEDAVERMGRIDFLGDADQKAG